MVGDKNLHRIRVKIRRVRVWVRIRVKVNVRREEDGKEQITKRRDHWEKNKVNKA
jgi:hypothetical protein